MDTIEINRDKEPIRLFKSDFLEFFSHISPVAVIALWLPVAAGFLISSILNRAAFRSPWFIPLALFVGLFIWTLAEYTLHRFLFHFHPRSAWQERAAFLFHGVHHAQPQCKTRLVMPFPLSIPLALLFYALFSWVVGALFAAPHWIAPVFSGFMFGYLAYDLTHYATHHIPMYGRYPKFLKRHHMLHHMKTPNQRFGVSSHLWDVVFGTLPPDPRTV